MRPLWPGFLADPMVLRVGDVYYAYGTDGPEDRVLRETGRMFPILRSRDLERWEFVGGALRPPGVEAAAFWAPEVALKNGRFYLYYSCGGREGEAHKLRVAISEGPEGPFVDQKAEIVPDEPFSIDAHPFHDPVSRRWFLFFAKDFFDEPVGTGIAAAPLSEDMLSITDEPSTLLRAEADWQVFERSRFWYGRTWPIWNTVEGPFVVFREGRYWLFYSGGRWEASDYGVGCASSENVLGPYIDPLVKEGASVLRTSAGGLTGPGHNSVVAGPDGGDFIAFHAWDIEYGARRLHVARLTWTEDGPVVTG